MPVTPEASMSDLLDQAVETIGGAMRASVKLQEDMAQWWTDAIGHVGSMQDWQRKSSAVMTEAIPTAQKNADEYLRLFDQSYHSGLDLLKKAFDTGRYDSMQERQAKAQDLWESSLETVRNNAQAAAQANVRVMESWAEFLKKNIDSTQAVAKAATKASKEK